ncbi:hypothetical protein P9112_002064 [Eukaryota sp. TZLM1-RC]
MFSKLLHHVGRTLDFTITPQLASFSFLFQDSSLNSSRDDLLRFSARRLLSLPFAYTFFHISSSPLQVPYTAPTFGALTNGLLAEVPSSVLEVSSYAQQYLSFCSFCSHVITTTPFMPTTTSREPNSIKPSPIPRAWFLSNLPTDPTHAGGYLLALGVLEKLAYINSADLKYCISMNKFTSIGIILGYACSSIGLINGSFLEIINENISRFFLASNNPDKVCSQIFTISLLSFGLIHMSRCLFSASFFLLDIFHKLNTKYNTQFSIFHSERMTVYLTLALGLGCVYYQGHKECPLQLRNTLTNLIFDRDTCLSTTGVVALGLIYSNSNDFSMSQLVNPDLTNLELTEFPCCSLLFTRCLSSALICPEKSFDLLRNHVSNLTADDVISTDCYLSKCSFAQMIGTLVGCSLSLFNSEYSSELRSVSTFLFKRVLLNSSILPSFILNSVCLAFALNYSTTCSYSATRLIFRYQTLCQGPDTWMISSLSLSLVNLGQGKFYLQNVGFFGGILNLVFYSILLPISSGTGTQHYCPLLMLSSFLLIKCLKTK